MFCAFAYANIQMHIIRRLDITFASKMSKCAYPKEFQRFLGKDYYILSIMICLLHFENFADYLKPHSSFVFWLILYFCFLDDCASDYQQYGPCSTLLLDHYSAVVLFVYNIIFLLNYVVFVIDEEYIKNIHRKNIRFFITSLFAILHNIP